MTHCLCLLTFFAAKSIEIFKVGVIIGIVMVGIIPFYNLFLSAILSNNESCHQKVEILKMSTNMYSA